MGWLFTDGIRRSQLIMDRVRPWKNAISFNTETNSIGYLNKDDTPEYEIHTTFPKYCYRGGIRGGCLWKITEQKVIRIATQEVVHTEQFIALDLLRYSNYENRKSWGYKDMTEHSGPYYYSCPLSYLKEVPCPENKYAKDWREKVLQLAEEKKNVYKPHLGEKVELIAGCKIRWVQIRSANRKLLGVGPDGVLYRVKKTHIVGPWKEIA